MAYRTEIVQFKVRKEEKEKLKEQAKKEKMTLSEYVRNKVLK